MKIWKPSIEWVIDILETHALFFALKSQVERKIIDPNEHFTSTWIRTATIPRVRVAPIPEDFDFLKKVCEDELNYLADSVGDEPYGCDIANCRVHNHRMGLRYFMEDKLGVNDKFANTGIH